MPLLSSVLAENVELLQEQFVMECFFKIFKKFSLLICLNANFNFSVVLFKLNVTRKIKIRLDINNYDGKTKNVKNQ